MTLEASQRIVAVAANILMLVVRLTLVVAARTQTAKRARTARSMAKVAGDVVFSGQRECVLEGCGPPRSRIVASLAVLGEVQSHVVGPARVIV